MLRRAASACEIGIRSSFALQRLDLPCLAALHDPLVLGAVQIMFISRPSAYAGISVRIEGRRSRSNEAAGHSDPSFFEMVTAKNRRSMFAAPY